MWMALVAEQSDIDNHASQNTATVYTVCPNISNAP